MSNAAWNNNSVQFPRLLAEIRADEGFPLPEWAERRSDGTYMEAGAQLATRDGRKCGNARVTHVEPHDRLGQVAVVVTDMGSTFRMTEMELADAFYPPAYVMKP